MLALIAIERQGLTPSSGPALVTGAAGGVGSTAISLLADKGWKVIASTGRASESDYLKALGAAEIIERATLTAPGKPLGKEQWAAAVDSVGSTTLANVLAQTRYGGAVAACGLAGGMDLPTTVAPFILRGVSLLGHRQRPLPDAAPARGVAAARGRTRPRQARGDDRDHSVRSGVRRRSADPERRDPGPAGGDDPVKGSGYLHVVMVIKFISAKFSPYLAKSSKAPTKPEQRKSKKKAWISGGREGHTANFVKNAAHRAARGRVGVAWDIQACCHEYCS